MKQSVKRYNSGRVIASYSEDIPPLQLIRNFIRCELAFGGVVTDITPTSVEVKTRVLSSEDVTTYSGTEEEIAPFVEIAKLSLISTKILYEENLEELTEKTMNITNGNPFLVFAASGMIAGEHIAHLAMARACSFKNDELMKKFIDQKVRYNDLVSAHELIENGATCADIESLIFN